MILETTRSRWRLPVGSVPNVIGCLYLCGALIYTNAWGRMGLVTSGFFDCYPLNYGWPLVFCTRWICEPQPQIKMQPPYDQRRTYSVSFNGSLLLLDSCLAVALIASTGLAIRRLLRAGPRLRFTLWTLMASVAIFAVLFSLLRHERSPEVIVKATVGGQIAIYFPASLFPFYVSIALFVAIVATLYASASVVFRITGVAVEKVFLSGRPSTASPQSPVHPHVDFDRFSAGLQNHTD